MIEWQPGESDLTEKKGRPNFPSDSQWENSHIRITLEHLLTFFFEISWFKRPFKASQLWDCDNQTENDFLNGWRRVCLKREQNELSDDHLHVCGHHWCNVRFDDSGSALCKQYSNTEPGCWHGSRNLLLLTDDNPLAMQSFYPELLFLHMTKQTGGKDKFNEKKKKILNGTFLYIFFYFPAACSHREHWLAVDVVFDATTLSAFQTQRYDNSRSRSQSRRR